MHLVETSLVRAVIHKQHSHRPLIVALGDGAETFLAASVPDFQEDVLVVDDDILALEVDS